MAEPAPAATPAATITPRLNPPLGRTLTYHVTSEKIMAAVTERSAFDQQVTFSRLGEGYAMAIRMVRLEVGGKSYDFTAGTEGMPASVRALTMPMTLELDRNGRPLRLHDWPAYGQALVALAPQMATEVEPDAAKRPAAEAYFRKLLQARVAMSAEAAVGGIVLGWPSMLGELGRAVTPGHDDTAMLLLPSPFGPGALEHRTTARWSADAAAGTLTLTRLSEPTPEAMPAARGVMETAIRQAAPAGAQIKEDVVKQALERVKATLTNTATFDRETGLLRSAVLEKHLILPVGEATERITMTAR